MIDGRLGLALAAGLLLASTAKAETIKLGTLAPEGSPWHQILREMGEEWRRVSDGRVVLKIYPGGIAGDDPDMVRKMRIGQLQAAALSGAGLTAIARDLQALQMPMMFSSNEELDYVRRSLSPMFEKALADKGFRLLFWGDAGWVRFFTQTPVIAPDDLKPLKLFIWSQETSYIEAWKDAGFRPVPLAATDIHAALQSGLINAFTTTPLGALSFQWFALAPHMTDLKWAPLIGGLVVTNAAWERIPVGIRERLAAPTRRAAARMRMAVVDLERRAVEAMREHGLVVHSVPDDIAREWERRVRAGYPRIIGVIVPAYAVDEVERVRREFRANGNLSD